MALGDNGRAMRPRPDQSSLLPRSPARVFALVLLVVFAAEGAIMLALPCLPAGWRHPLVDSLLDATALTVVMSPAVWFLAVLPLRRSFEARGRGSCARSRPSPTPRCGVSRGA